VGWTMPPRWAEDYLRAILRNRSATARTKPGVGERSRRSGTDLRVNLQLLQPFAVQRRLTARRMDLVATVMRPPARLRASGQGGGMSSGGTKGHDRHVRTSLSARPGRPLRGQLLDQGWDLTGKARRRCGLELLATGHRGGRDLGGTLFVQEHAVEAR
jgi:hypothetical protein